MTGGGVLPGALLPLLDALGIAVRGATPVTGGMISRAARIDGDERQYFVKWQSGEGATSYDAEVVGLEALARTGVIRVPEVIATGDFRSAPGGIGYLLLEYIPAGSPASRETFGGRLAAQLALLHRKSAGAGGYGFHQDNFVGRLPQWNVPPPAHGARVERWSDFYRLMRLLPQIECARQAGLLTAERERLLMGVVERLPELLNGIPEESCLLHGDLWRGNCLSAEGGEPVLIDPAVYFGHREMEIAFVELFGGFPPGFVEAYHDNFPLDEGYGRRRPLHQLYHLLNHWNHFGEPYGERCAQVCRFYLG